MPIRLTQVVQDPAFWACTRRAPSLSLPQARWEETAKKFKIVSAKSHWRGLAHGLGF